MSKTIEQEAVIVTQFSDQRLELAVRVITVPRGLKGGKYAANGRMLLHRLIPNGLCPRTTALRLEGKVHSSAVARYTLDQIGHRLKRARRLISGTYAPVKCADLKSPATGTRNESEKEKARQASS